MTASLTYETADLAGTMAFGRALARHLRAGTVMALVGPLGAGKTHLVRAVAEGLGIADSRAVCSPTFVLIQEYDARLPVYHFDTYRLRNPEEFFDLGVHEYFEGDGVCLVEWGDRVEKWLPPDHLRLTITVTGKNSRRILLEGTGDRSRAIVRDFAASEFLGGSASGREGGTAAGPAITPDRADASPGPGIES
jgi:tRNA threonylcarbamoyladenosine biosynthesis protein TsaE